MPMSEFGGFTFTIQSVAIEDGKILLVHEKDHTDEGGRRAGWNLPGGNTEGWNIERTYRQIINFLPVEVDPSFDENYFRQFLSKDRMDNVFFSFFGAHPDYRDQMSQIGQLVYLTSIREEIEETGLLTRPQSVLFEEPTRSEKHRLLVIHSVIVAGKPRERSLETDACGWFDPRNLPEGTFPSHRRRIALATYKLRVRAEQSSQILDLII